jgi:type IV pilus assembly protein PilQ
MPVHTQNGIIQNVLFKNTGNNAEAYILYSNPETIKMYPSSAGYVIAGHQKVAKRGSSGNGVKVQRGAGTHAPVSVTNKTQVAKLPVSPAVSDVRFVRNAKGGGSALISLHGAQPKINITKEKYGIVLTLYHTNTPSEYQHMYSTTQFGTVVKGFSVYPRATATRLVLTTSSTHFKYSVYQIGNVVRLDVSKAVNQGETAAEEKQQELSMHFQNIPVRDVLQVIAQFTHSNIVLSNSVSGNMTLNLKDVPWKQALSAIMESQGLGMKHIGPILWVAPASQIASQETSELKFNAAKRKTEPLVTEMLPLNYIKASTVATILNGFSAEKGGYANRNSQMAMASLLGGQSARQMMGTNLLGSRGSVEAVASNNSLLVRDTPSNIKNIVKLVKVLDKPAKQIVIKARIVQITTAAAKTLGVSWGGTYTGSTNNGVVNLSGTQTGGTMIGQGGSYSPYGTSSPGLSGVPSLVNLPAALPAGSALAGLSPASLGLALGTAAGNKILDLQLQALQANNDAKIISSPEVLTSNNAVANIEQGQEIPYQMASSSGATAVSFKKAVLSLKVTPHITPNGDILMTIKATNNQPNYAEATPSGIPINTQSVDTALMIKNGHTVVIGGIYTKSTSITDTGVPYLKKIPLLGWLFKSHARSVEKTELLIFLTPVVAHINTPH